MPGHSPSKTGVDALMPGVTRKRNSQAASWKSRGEPLWFRYRFVTRQRTNEAT